MANFIPMDDGVTHLNAYSGAKTELGRFLSNFAYCPIETEDGHFNSVEGYWGWLSIPEDNPRREELRGLSGFAAKQRTKELLLEGRREIAVKRFDDRFSEKIAAAIHAKFQTEQAKRLLSENKELLRLPIVHYYARDTKVGTEIKDVTDKYPEFMDNIRREVALYLESVNQEKPSLFGISEGVICQQVNCQDVMGAGLARAIMGKYPEVSRRYHETFKRNSKESLFGKVDLIQLSDTLYVANIYSQFRYGNPSRTGQVYTDAEKLVKAVDGICRKMPNLPVYLPHTKGTAGNMEGGKTPSRDDGIGCGYGGETWSHLSPMFESLGHKNLHLLDTKTGRVHEFDENKEVDKGVGARRVGSTPSFTPLLAPSSKSSSIVGLSFMESFSHVKSKYPPCKGMSAVGNAMERFQADLASKYGYKPLPQDVQSNVLDIYLSNLPDEFMPKGSKWWSTHPSLGSKSLRPTKGGVEIAGKRQPLVLKDGTKIAEGYDRIVVGNYGAFIEIDEKDIRKEILTTRKGEEYREGILNYRKNVKYFWKTVGDTEAKIYEQRKGVAYADYREGKYYISPYEVMGRDEMKAAGLTWNEEFTPILCASEENQISLDIDPALYKGRPVAFDLETTGLSSTGGDEILQIAVVNDESQVLLNVYTGTVQKKSWPAAEKVNHITPDMVAGKPAAASYANVLATIFGKASSVVGHNVAFDLSFVKSACGVKVSNTKVSDTCTYFKRDFPNASHHKLADAVKAYCPEHYESYALGAHDACTDALTTMRVYKAQREKSYNKIMSRLSECDRKEEEAAMGGSSFEEDEISRS